MARLFDDASSQFIEHAGALVTAVPVTMACWAFPDVDTLSIDLMSLSNTGADNDGFRLNLGGATAGDPVRAIVAQSAAFSIATSASGFTVNTWCHAAAVFASSTSRTAYINGVGGTAETTSRTPTNTPNRTTIGRTTGLNPAAHFSGRIAEAAIWNVALTAGEIAALAQRVSPLLIRRGNLISYAPLWGLHSPEIDLVPGGGTWAVTGATLANHAPVTPFTRLERAIFPLHEEAAAGGVPRHSMYYQRLRAA